jgi:hypothetical protein
MRAGFRLAISSAIGFRRARKPDRFDGKGVPRLWVAMTKPVLSVAFATAWIGPAAAADFPTGGPLPPIAEPGGFEARWHFNAAAYLWMPGITGTAGVAGLEPVDVDASFLDLLENLDVAFMAVAEARYDRFGIFTDLMYTKLSAGGTGPLGAFSADVSSEMIVGTVMGEYRLVEQGKTTVDVMAGARVWGVTGDLEITATGGVPTLGATFSGQQYWVDPMIGVKTRVQGASPWYLTGTALIGGFGVSADLDWDLFGGLGYEINDRFSLVAGYRAVGVDYSHDGFVVDIIQSGPILGGVLRF